ncbi:DNA/RNA non-specific endonuclease [Pontibacter anaerobius]|uniref:DNA/RNA non-specific endonuclease n=1 Tax=Pontibacter anaerobius TaxID=2993940 RepID=A0ABT3RAE0_9BACT|nr:DNA/RNA non-specific endonuclease [Pontibacter anaerobius]MCX2738337.1 DNA/RNA non-specific endonuclease [Pontibacter anaerobius]
MKHLYLTKWVVLLVSLFSLTSCESELDKVSPTVVNVAATAPATIAPYDEDFETGYKGSYAAASVPFANGSWSFQEALTGNTSSDVKSGLQSARIRDLGLIGMEFDLPDGAKSFAFSYAKYGKDKNSQLEVYYSTDGGSSWQQAGSTVTVSSFSLQQLSIPLNVTGPVRFQIRKVGGGSNRVNVDNVSVEANPVVVAPAFAEDFEGGSKGSYASGSVSLASGSWLLNEALIGTLDSDRKVGTKSVRIRDLGSLAMEFDLGDAQAVQISHAVYGTDGASTWELQASTNGGASWTKVGNTVTSSSITLETISFDVAFTSPVRFRVVKLSGAGNRINIDNFIVNGSGGSGSGSGSGGSGGTGGTGGGTSSGLGAVHLTMGNPTNAVIDLNAVNNYLLEKEEYVMSYSRDRGSANWVSWHLDEAWLGSTPRQDDFRADITLPAGWYQVGSTDYTGSGFDRGHMCPSADRTLSVDDNSNTFLMTNMIPQAPNNNRLGWASLESYCRSMLTGGYEIYIISGVYGVGGTGSNGYATTIAGGMVTVPSNTWKVILIIPDGDDDVNRVTTNTRVIAIDMPNDQNVSSDWRTYRTSVDMIEAKTGYDFFSLVADNVENVIEASVDNL